MGHKISPIQAQGDQDVQHVVHIATLHESDQIKKNFPRLSDALCIRMPQKTTIQKGSFW